MQTKKSLLQRFLGLFSSKTENETETKERENDESLYLKMYNATIAAALPDNLVKQGGEENLIIKAEHKFYGEEENAPELNSIRLRFNFPYNKKAQNLDIDCYIPLSEEKILCGTYTFNETPSRMSMDGYLYLFWQENEDKDYQSKTILITGGKLEVKKEEDNYLITGEFETENDGPITLHYEGPLRFISCICSVNGDGRIEFEGKEYPFDTLVEYNNGIRSALIETTKYNSYWSHYVEIKLEARDAWQEKEYKISLTIGIQKEQNKIPTGQYKITDQNYDTPAGTFKGFLGISDEDDEEYTVYDIVDGTLTIDRNEYLILKGEYILDNGSPLRITYTGKPHYIDYS